MIIYICKFLHLISLFIAGGGGIGSAVIQSIYKKEGKVPEPHLAKGFKVLAFLSLLAIITMWVTGIILLLAIYGSFILITAIFINMHLYVSARKSLSPNQKYIKNSGSLSRLGLILAIAGAIGSFV
jgi:hypothetical protein